MTANALHFYRIINYLLETLEQLILLKFNGNLVLEMKIVIDVGLGHLVLALIVQLRLTINFIIHLSQILATLVMLLV